MESLQEAELIEQARLGDELAWEVLVRCHQESVFRLAYLVLGDPDDAEDVAQEAFIRAYKYLGRFDSTRPFKPWILKIVSNLARNKKRSMGRYFSIMQKWIRDEKVVENDIESKMVDKLDSQLLWEAIRSLGKNDQTILYLRYFLEVTVDESAEVLGVASGTIKSRTHRALTRLRQAVDKQSDQMERIS